MTKESLKIIKEGMDSLGLTYNFGEYSSLPAYPYFVGEYQEVEPMNEDGLQESAFIITGFSRSTWLSLEEAKDKIKKYFDRTTGKTQITETGAAVAIYYSNSQVIPTGDAELKKIQINLDIKEWSE